MFGLNTGKCKRILQQAMSDCFDPLKGEIGNVPTTLNDSKYITACMIGVCEAYAQQFDINKPQSIALIIDAVFEEVFRADTTDILNQTDRWQSSGDDEFTAAYQQAKTRTSQGGKQLNIDWLKAYALEHFEPARTLML